MLCYCGISWVSSLIYVALSYRNDRGHFECFFFFFFVFFSFERLFINLHGRQLSFAHDLYFYAPLEVIIFFFFFFIFYFIFFLLRKRTY